MPKDDDICFIHKVAYTKTVIEEPIPTVGITKFITYKCPMCVMPIEETVYATDK